MNRKVALEANLKSLRAELSTTTTKLMVVTKTQSIEDIRTLYELGQRDFGENRVQELEEKANALRELSEIRWHLIGHLQTNKVNKLAKIPGLVAIHSVDSEELILKLMKGLEGHSPIGLFLQVNTSHEDEKRGLEDLSEVMKLAKLMDGARTPVFLQGLMTMGTIRTDNVAEEARRCFKALIEMRDQLKITGLELSMGMSGDYLIARDLGSSWVRVGSKIFKV